MQECVVFYSTKLITAGCTNPRHHVATGTKYSTVAPHMFGSSVRYFFYVALMVPKIL